MVKALITHKCESHHTNPNYKTLLIIFDGKDTNVRPIGLRGDWQPRDVEVLSIVKLLADISPTFAEKLTRLAIKRNWRNTKTAKSRPITDLAELLL